MTASNGPSSGTRRRRCAAWGLRRRLMFLRGRGSECQVCGAPIPTEFMGGREYALFEIDHFLALQYRGRDDRRNLGVLCPNCHREKSQREAVLQMPWCPVHRVTYAAGSADHSARQCLRWPEVDTDLARFAYAAAPP